MIQWVLRRYIYIIKIYHYILCLDNSYNASHPVDEIKANTGDLMEAATQPQAYEHSQTIFGLAVARRLVEAHSFIPGGNGQTCTTLSAELSVMANCWQH